MMKKMTTGRPAKRKPPKFTGSAKITLAALSVIGFVSSWNLIARLDDNKVQANEGTPVPPPPPPLPLPPPPGPTPWPTIPLLADIPPIPTLNPTLTTAGQPADLTSAAGAAAVNVAPAPLQLAPLPTLAPLPEMPAPPPPPPPPPPAPAGGGNRSGGS